MEVSSRWLIFLSIAVCTASAFTYPARAYDEYSHEWITRSAFDYLRSNPHVYPETAKWTEELGPDEKYLESVMVRAVVDTDYRSDMWLNAWFHNSIDGGRTSGVVAMFTTMFHFLTITSPGRFWDYDGYSYWRNTHSGNDTYLNEPSVHIGGRQSAALGGRAPAGHVSHGADLGVYNVGFKGNTREWNQMYYEGFASEAVLPPSYVPASVAYSRMLASSRAPESSTESWSEQHHLVTGILSNTTFQREYWRGEVAGLPHFADAVGIVMHLTQDATVPHHVEDTSDRCHPEYEKMMDLLACGSPSTIDYTKYYIGNYGDAGFNCTALYDPGLVAKILAEENLYEPLSVQERMIRAGTVSSRWDWRVRSKKRYATLLPDGKLFQSNSCQTLLGKQEIQDQMKYQFNFAVAETVAIFEIAAHQYETLHGSEKPPVAFPFNLLWSAP